MRKVKYAFTLCLVIALVSGCSLSGREPQYEQITVAGSEDKAVTVTLNETYTVLNPGKEGGVTRGFIEFTAAEEGDYVMKLSNAHALNKKSKNSSCHVCVSFERWNEEDEVFEEPMDTGTAFVYSELSEENDENPMGYPYETEKDMEFEMEEGETIRMIFEEEEPGVCDLQIVKDGGDE